MRIISGKVTNFASYRELEFEFNNQGLALISGPTGAGKSTLCDIIPWVLFGITSKNGAVDEIRSWNNDAPTTGVLYLDNVTISRSRGKGANDLSYWPIDGVVTRGKDMNDTQKLINNLIGIDAEEYLSGAYLHEFSQTALFFTTTAKNRRQLTEQLADLSMSSNLIDNISDYKREVKNKKEQLDKDAAVLKGKLEQTREMIQNAKTKMRSWQSDQDMKILHLQEQMKSFDSQKALKIKKIKAEFDAFEEGHKFQQEDFKYKIEQLQSEILKPSYFEENKINTEILMDKCDKEKCPECGNALKSDKKLFYLRQLNEWKTQETANNQKLSELKIAKATLKLLEGKENPYVNQLLEEKQRENTFEDQVETAELERNPYDQIHVEHIKKASILQKSLTESTEEISDFAIELDDLDTLSKVIDDFRGLLIQNTVTNLQNSTNKLLNDYFDAEIRVNFNVENADKLEVMITKDGNQCVFSQLSKGQRQLLKLCFGTSVMYSIAYHNGIGFNAIFLDEPMDGMDEALKIKGYRLLEKLSTEYDSVFVIDHSEALKSMFTKRYDVVLENGLSQVNES